jgi:hypothetical protein
MCHPYTYSKEACPCAALRTTLPFNPYPSGGFRMSDDCPEDFEEPVMVKAKFDPLLSERENWDFLLARVSCSHANMFDTCFIGRCRRHKRCDVFHKEWKSRTGPYAFCPPCIRTDADFKHMVERLKFLMDQAGKNSPIYGPYLIYPRLPPPHRIRK